MNPALQEEDIDIYAPTATTIQEPQGAAYSQGVNVGRVVPAKFWNWLFKAITKRIHESFQDMCSFFTELKNVLLFIGITPSALDDAQLAQAATMYTNDSIRSMVATYLVEHTKAVALELSTDSAQYPSIDVDRAFQEDRDLHVSRIKRPLHPTDTPCYFAQYGNQYFVSRDLQNWNYTSDGTFTYYDPALSRYYSFVFQVVEDPDEYRPAGYRFSWLSRAFPTDSASQQTEYYDENIAGTDLKIFYPAISTWQDANGDYCTLVVVPNGRIAICKGGVLQWFDRPQNYNAYALIDYADLNNASVVSALVLQDSVYVGNLKVSMAENLADWQIEALFDNVSVSIGGYAAAYGTESIKALALANNGIAFVFSSSYAVPEVAGKILTPEGILHNPPDGIVLTYAYEQSSAFKAVLAVDTTDVTKYYFSTDGVTFQTLPFKMSTRHSVQSKPAGWNIIICGHAYVLYDYNSSALYMTPQLSASIDDYVLLNQSGVLNNMCCIGTNGLLLNISSASYITYDFCKHLHKLTFEGNQVSVKFYSQYRISLAGDTVPIVSIDGTLCYNAECHRTSPYGYVDYAFRLQDNRVHDFTLYR